MNLEDQIRNIPDLKTRLDRFMERQGGRTVTVQDVSYILGTDMPSADKFLEEWSNKHANDCSPVSLNPRGVRVYSTILRDPNVVSQKEKRQKKLAAKQKYLREKREWNEL